MFLHRIRLACALLVLIGLFAGCSGGGSPVEPTGDIPTQVPVQSGSIREGEELSGSHVSFGVYEIRLDTVNWTAEVSMKRGLQWHINILPFLLPPFCPNNDCMVISNFEEGPFPGTAQFDGTLKHPFAGDPNLDGFDVRGIGLLNPNTTFPSGKVPVDVILNADGYTNLWNDSPFVPQSDINPFRAFWTTSNMRKFENGKSATRKYIVKFPEGEFAFDIAIDASFEFPDIVDPDDPSTSPNIWEAYEITGTLTESISETLGSEALLQITVSDWQENPGPVSIEAPDLFAGSLQVGDPIGQEGYVFSYETMLTNSNGVGPGRYPVLLKVVDSFDVSVPDLDLITYNVLQIDVQPYSGPLPPVAMAKSDVNEVFTGEQVHFDAYESYDPDGQISTYLWDINGDGSYGEETGVEATGIYSNPGVVKVDVQVFDMDGMWDKLDEKLTITVLPSPNDSPVAIASSNTLHTSVGGFVKFFGDESYDPDGVISTYAWDLDNDQIFGEPGEDEDLMNPIHQFNIGGEYFVWLRVQDDFGAWDQTNFPIVIDVSGENVPPIASGFVSCIDPFANKILDFVSTSDDPDGFITEWEWDFDDGAGWQDFTPSEGLATHAFSSTGTYNVQHRVTDSSGIDDTLDFAIVINVGDGGFTPPAPYDCSAAIDTHLYQLDLGLEAMNHFGTFDVCGTPDGNWLLASMGKLIEMDAWGTVVDSNFHTLQGDGPMLLSLDYDDVNGNYAYVYSHPLAPTEITVIDLVGDPVATISVGENLRAVCFDWEGNVWVLTESFDVRVFNASDSFNEDPCVGYSADVGIEGRVFDMAFDFYNHALYIFSQGSDGLGQLVKLNSAGAHDGTVTQIFDPLAVGYSNSGDIIIDNSGDPGTSDCRIELFCGDSATGVTRFDSELNVIDQGTFSFWGCKAAAILPVTGIVIVLEACCGGYFDRYLPTANW